MSAPRMCCEVLGRLHVSLAAVTKIVWQRDTNGYIQVLNGLYASTGYSLMTNVH